MTEHADYPAFRRALKWVHKELDTCRALLLDLYRDPYCRHTRKRARLALEDAGVLEPMKTMTTRERRSRQDKSLRKWHKEIEG